MRGSNGMQEALFTLAKLEDFVASEHPLRPIRLLVNEALARQLMEQVRYNLLYRWFIGLAIDDVVWDHSTFSKNRDRLLEHASSPRS